MQVSLAELIDKLRDDTHPQGLPENLVATYERLVVEGLIVLQKWVDCLQQNNTQLYPFCSTYWDCNATVVPAPKGRIKRVYTVQSDQGCDKVFYRQLSHERLLCAAKAYGLVEAPDQTDLPEQEEPFKLANKSTDMCRGRSRYGYFSIHRNRVYAFPFLHSSETLVIEWDGLKRDWKSDDLVTGDPEVHRTLRLYVSKEMSRDYDRDLNSYQTQAIEYQESLRDLIHECREETRIRDHHICDTGACSDENMLAIEAATAATPSTSVVFANIGDFGNAANGTALEDVANLVKSWAPAFIVTNGDNIYNSADYAGIVGGQYGTYITSDLQTNKFWPALGNHDYVDAGLAIFQAYFTLPNNERYYDLIRHGVHFFIVNSSIGNLGGSTPEPDGVISGGVQGDWLRLSLAVSSARWKVVIVHDPPYTDHAADFPGHAVLRWPYKAWGADVVISGDAHAYFRYTVDGLPYLVNGLGGATIVALQATPNANDSIRQASYNGNHGAIKGTISCDTLTFEFINILGTVVDTLTLTK